MMAKRSDFAQKLLDDLRLRKERMGNTQTSSRTNPMTGGGRGRGDAYGSSRQTYKGTREKFTYKTVDSTSNMNKRSTGGNRPLPAQDTSKQIVPVGRGRGSEHRGDLSMALAFALENGVKLGRTDSSSSSSILGFLHQIGKGSLDFGKIEKRSSFDKHQPSTSRFPTLSNLHVTEISKGAQKLNQILKACSNGHNFDRYSIEIGKELLKGAMDLEESLRMLVNLQEASENMVNPQRKNRIRLLEEDEEDDGNTVAIVEQRQLDRPRFSFDKPSRNSHGMQEVSRTGLKQKLATLTYQSKDPSSNHGQQAVTAQHLVSHSRSASHGPDIRTITTFSKQNSLSSSSVSKPEKKGLPNVIAKLMGLQELPDHVESKQITTPNESSSKQKKEGTISKKNAQWSTKNEGPKTKETQNLAPQTVKQKAIQANRISIPQDSMFVQQAAKNLPTSNSSLEMVVYDGKPPRADSENVEGTKPMASSRNATTKIYKEHIYITHTNQFTGSPKDIREKERRQDNAKRRERTGAGKSETNAAVSKDELRQMAHRSPEAANILQEQIRGNESMLQTEKRSINKLVVGNQHKPHKDHGNVLGISKPQKEKHLAEEKEHQTVKQNLSVRKEKGSEPAFRSTSKPMHDTMDLQKKKPHTDQAMHSKRSSTEANKGSPSIMNHKDLVKDETSTSSKVIMKSLVNGNSGQIVSQRDLEAELEKEKAGNLSTMEEKPVQIVQVAPSQKDVRNTKVHHSRSLRKIDEVVTRKNQNPGNLSRPLKQQISVLQEMKHRRVERFSGAKRADRVSSSGSKEAAIRIVKSGKPEASIQPLNVEQKLPREVEQVSAFYNPVEDECQPLKDLHIQAPNDSCQITTPEASPSNQEQEQAPTFGKDRELTSHETLYSSFKGPHERNLDISYPSKLEHQRVHKLRKEEPLTDNEIHLKQILILNQLFLNTAEALFKLNIPVGILHSSSSHNRQDDDSKLILDCGYEIMKRKGRRRELVVHPFMKTSISSIKIRSFNDLVKQLHKDFEWLKSYDKNESNGCDSVGYCVPKMLEKDIQQKMDPDTNCMWDFGWNEMMFAFIEKDDVTRDVERHVLNGLIDEITMDLLHVSVSS